MWTPLVACVLAALTTSVAGASTCGDDAGDAAAVSATRAAIETACPCAGATNPRSYRSCARAVMSLRVHGGLLRARCRRQVRACVVRSVCGRPGRLACCGATSDGPRCRIVEASRCLRAGGCVGAYTSCCDACDAGGCVPLITPTTTPTTSTSSTTTSTSSSTTRTTLGPRNCGNGVIDRDEMCDGEPFCESCYAFPRVCCQFQFATETCSFDLDLPFVCDPGFPGTLAKPGATATGTDPCGAGFGSNGPCGDPTPFPPTPICCDGPAGCTTVTVSDTAELTSRILTNQCVPVIAGVPTPVYVVGECAAASGPCLRAH